VRATIIGIFVSAALAAVKVISGLAGHSYALIADGVESMLDIMSALVVLGTLRISATPPNERFPYGYGKAESLGAVVVATGLFIAATGIAVQSVREILSPQQPPANWTLVVLVLVVTTKELLFRFLDRTGGEIGSKAMESDAWHQRSDALTSAAAFIGISIAVLGGEGYEAADDWAALFACAVIAANGFRLLRSALRDVMDAAPPPETEEEIRNLALSVEGVEDVDKCLVRRSGLGVFVDLHIEVDGRKPVRDGHEIAHRTKDTLIASDLSVLDVSVHVEPYPNPYK
jgi:cation diffusion facilitator family transporter